MKNVHTTSLGSFLSCAYKFKYDTAEWNYAALGFGTNAHSIIEMTMLGLQDGANLLLSKLSVSDRGKINHMVDIVTDKLKTTGYTLVMGEYKNSFTIGEDRLEGTFDWLVKDSDGEYHMIDLKTAAGEWSQEQLEQQVQCHIYPTMLYKTFGIRCKTFQYWVMTKHAIPRFYIYTIENPVDEEKIESRFNAYITAHKEEIFLPNHGSYLCKYCKLGTKCGKYGGQSNTPF